MGTVGWEVLRDNEITALEAYLLDQGLMRSLGYPGHPRLFPMDGRDYRIGFPILAGMRYNYVLREDDLQGWVRRRVKDTDPTAIDFHSETYRQWWKTLS